jgi:integrase
MTRKRGNNEGSIYPYKKNGKKVGYRGAYTSHTAGGPKRRYVSGKTREEVRRKLAKAMGDRDGGLVFDAGNLTVGVYMDRWLRDVKDTVRQSTHERYGYAIGPHIKPAIGRIKLKDLTSAQVRWFYRDRLDYGLAPATVHKLHVVLHKALKSAVSDGLIPRNPTASLKLPRIIKEEIDPLDQEEARRLLEAACGDRLEALYVLAINTGMRQGELLALKWEDVDLERSVLRVRRTISRRDNAYVLDEPKTKKSRRTIRLTAGAATALEVHLSRQLEGMERMGSLYQPGGLVFATTTGTISTPPT